jgi:hypothetical protein
MSNVRSTTSPAPTLEGYPEPEQQLQRERMLAQMRKLPKVNGQGFPIPGPDPSVVNVVEPGAPPPSMAEALQAAAQAVGADLPALLDSQSFCTAIGAISPADSAGLENAIRDHMPAPAPGMAPNRVQTGIGGSVPTPGSGTLLDRVRAQTAKHADQPLPPGSTVL